MDTPIFSALPGGRRDARPATGPCSPSPASKERGRADGGPTLCSEHERAPGLNSPGGWPGSRGHFEGEYDVPQLCHAGLLRAERHAGRRRRPPRSASRAEHDLFGGVVPHPFVATKAITHPLVEPDAAAPAGWMRDVRRAASAMRAAPASRRSPRDARRAGLRLLRARPGARQAGAGDRRPRPARGARRARRWTRVLAAMDAAEIADHGLVLEENLGDVAHLQRRPGARGRAVGQLLRHAAADDATTGATGLRRLGPDGRARRLRRAAGADAAPTRSAWRSSRRAPTTPRWSTASRASCLALQLRRGAGPDAAGRWRSGVLEQSWRIGGASGAEIAALEAFAPTSPERARARLVRRGLRRGRACRRRTRPCYFQRRRRQRSARSPSTAVVEPR